MTLPEHMLSSESSDLAYLDLSKNMLTAIPENIFKPFAFISVGLEGNQLTTLPENIFSNRTDDSISIGLTGNPLLCDNDFLTMVQVHFKKIDDYNEIVCSDGKPLREKIDYLNNKI